MMNLCQYSGKPLEGIAYSHAILCIVMHRIDKCPQTGDKKATMCYIDGFILRWKRQGL